MPVISIASTKGGVGKTTLSRILVASLASESADFVAIDADPNDALSRWRSKFYSGPDFDLVREPDHDRLAHLIHERAQSREIVIVDTAGFNNQSATIAMTFSDSVLIPIMADEADMEGAEKTWQRCRGVALGARREIPAWVVMNSVKKTSQIHQHVLGELQRLAEEVGLRWLDTKLSNLVAYNEISWSGSLPDRGPAVQEIRHFMDELRRRSILPPATAASRKTPNA
ncbi:ParA family protein [Falsiroseomonas sp. E2-1-a20]|uniref:ParA family protein n=1 Tax=Falsiroseomonas sp. E2-1-a20 TaxID=3239300 RepID=UPI003F393554